MSIGKLIELYIAETGCTITEMAGKFGVSKNTIENWRYGKTMPNYMLFLDFCKMLGYEIIIRRKGETNDESCS